MSSGCCVLMHPSSSVFVAVSEAMKYIATNGESDPHCGTCKHAYACLSRLHLFRRQVGMHAMLGS